MPTLFAEHLLSVIESIYVTLYTMFVAHVKYFDPCLNVPTSCFLLQQFICVIDHTCVCAYTCTCLYVSQYFHGCDSDSDKLESAQDKHL